MTLARALTMVAVVRGMELDIHTRLTNFDSWAVRGDAQLARTSLLPTIQHTPDRYLDPDRRDFFYLTLAAPTPDQPWTRSAPPPPPWRSAGARTANKAPTRTPPS